ncbi:hypothetical protein L1I30_11045 [Gillisia sp. M10.2A]|uniref:Uncharacterized protein n=1 Tax=Gillisia lutea TaxID=2909668 RepID=A0ABS9EH73_9FLAO|nr:hypothetical protein [Gillisia lutea]MCF4102206.1 hypothetical protein [Gillisia lutea]
MNIELKKIIDKSYEVFADYKVEQTLDVCTECCVTKSEELELAKTDVRGIPFELLYTYHTAGKPQQPNITEFKHFAPRYLDLTANLKFVSHSTEIVLRSFGEINEWTDEETEILNSFGKEFFKHCLNRYPLPENEQISSILVMLDKENFGIADKLNNWEKFENLKSTLHFNDLINYGFNDKKPEKLSTGFADEKTNKILFDWVNNANTKQIFKERIERTIMNPTNITDKKQTELSWAYDRLNWKNAPQHRV